jgi:hypothetical protein
MRRLIVLFIFLLIPALPAMVSAQGEPVGPWRPEITERPRLMFGPEDLEPIRERLGREPYATLMQRVRARALRSYEAEIPPEYDFARETRNGNIAKAAAFVAWVDADADMAEKTAGILEVLATEFGLWDMELIDDDIHISEAILVLCQAFDTLAGTNLLDPERVAAIEERLGAMVANFYADYVDMLALFSFIAMNNHHTKTASAIGIAGMTLNQREDALKWFSYGHTEVAGTLLGWMTDEYGVVGEGPYYGMYSAANHLPFMLAFNRLDGQNGWFAKRRFCVSGPDCLWRSMYVTNHLDNPILIEMHDWYIKMRMPNGRFAPLDDSFWRASLVGLTAGIYQDRIYAWDWLENPSYPMHTNWIIELDVDFIAAWDDTVNAAPPGLLFGRHFYMPESGLAIYRSGWDEDDSFAMMVAENGKTRVTGAGHEHIENLSVTLFARGKYLLIDPGYVAWEEHQDVMMPEHHNIPTVWGSGPVFPVILGVGVGGQSAWFSDGMTFSGMPFAKAGSSWLDCDFERTMLFCDEDYLVVFDRMTADRPRPFGMYWHGLAGGDTGDPFIMQGDGATWDRGDAAVDVHVMSDSSDITLTELENVHGFQWMQRGLHSTLYVEAEEAEQAAFITVALPYDPDNGEQPLAFENIPLNHAAACRIQSDTADFALTQTGARHYVLAPEDTGSIQISTSLQLLLMRMDSDNEGGLFYMEGPGSLQMGNDPAFVVGQSNRVLMEYRPGLWTFSFGPGGNELLVITQEPLEIGGDSDLQYYRQGNTIRIWSTEATSFILFNRAGASINSHAAKVSPARGKRK